MTKNAQKNGRRHRVYDSYYEYVENVVNKCGHKYIVLDRKDFRAWRFEQQSNPAAKLPAGKLIKITPAKCKSYSCPICGRKKTLDLMARLKTVNLKNYRFFTLTLKNKYSYDDTIDNLKRVSECFTKLNNKLRKLPEYKGLEYFRVLEVGKDGMVHVHGLWNKYINQKTLSDIWLKITKDSYRVKVERVKSKNDAVEYLYKYLSKDVAKKDKLIDPKLFNMDLQNTAALFYELNKRRYNSSRNFFPKQSKIDLDKNYLPYYYEAETSKTIENFVASLVRQFKLTLDNFDFTYYFESDEFIRNLFIEKPAPPG
ncbi:MAG: protein rep [Sphingobacteriaceae bacterium]|nr:protein rep [Sphingobacteriaceae bacterium]